MQTNTLPHNENGFLVGDVIGDIRRANELLQSIKSDISAIKRAIMERPDGTGDGSSAGPSTQNQAAGNTQTGNNAANVNVNVDVNVDGGPAPAGERNETTPPHIDNRSVRADDPGATTRSSSRRRWRQGRADNAAEPRPRSERSESPIAGDTDTASPRNQNRARARDASGRFASENSGPAGPAAEPSARRDSRGRFSSNGEGDAQSQRTLLSGMADRIASAIAESGSDLEEVDPIIKAFNEVAEPMTKGYQILFGGEKEDEAWYRKIFKELRLFRREDGAYNRATRRSLRNLEERTPIVDDDGDSSFWGGLMGSILPWLLTAVSAICPMILTGIRAVFGGFGFILRTVLMGVFSPIGLAIGTVATAAWGLFTEDGRKFFADIGSRISETWGDAVEWFKSTFPGIIETFTELAEDIAELWQPIADFFKEKFGIVQKGADVVGKIADYIKEKAVDIKNKAVENVIEPGKSAIKIGVDAVKSIPKKLRERWEDAKQHLVEAAIRAGVDPGIVAKIAGFESGFNPEARPIRKDGSRISSAHGYGQFLDATWTQMVNKYGAKYGVQNAGNLTKQEAAKLRSDKDLQAAMLAEFTRENIEKGRAIGGSDDDANVYALHNLGEGTGGNFLKALKNNPNAKVNSIKGMTNAVISGNRSLYGDGNISVKEAYRRMGRAMKRNEVFAADIAMNASSVMPSIAPVSMPQSASAPAPTAPSLSRPPIIAEAPPLAVPLASDAGKHSRNISVGIDEARMDGGRKAAHVVLSEPMRVRSVGRR